MIQILQNKVVEKKFDVVILGGGAAGLFCAARASQRGANVLLLEKNTSVGKKIRISGGGRCNFTNIHTTWKNYRSQNPHFAKSALARFTPQDFIELVEKHGIAYHEKTLGQLFCDGSAQEIIDMLLREIDEQNCTVLTQADFQSVRYESGVYEVEFLHQNIKQSVVSQALVVASGGLSLPKLGANGIGYAIAKQFGLQIITPKPALVPLTFSPDEFGEFSALTGISVEADISCRSFDAIHPEPHFRENLLFTHRGISGPAILQISSYLDSEQALTIHITPHIDFTKEIENSHREKVEVVTFLSRFMPKRLAQTWCETYNWSKRTMISLSIKEREELAHAIEQWKLTPIGNEGFAKAEVTLGGIDTNELSSKTMEAKKQKGLYCIGEVVDVTGWLGGYNFQWAWSSAVAAADSL